MRIRLFGGIEVMDGAGQPAHFPTRKTALLLAALALAGAKGARREQLCAVFWPDRGESQARNSLRQALAALRRALEVGQGGARIEGDLELVALCGTSGDVDAWRFDELIAKGDAADLAEAAGMYRGDLLAGVALPEPLDQWFQPDQRAYRRKALELAERLGGIEGGDASACQTLAERLLAADPAAEEAHRALIRLYRRQGQQNAALRQFERCKEALKRELDAAPEAQTLALMTEPMSGGPSAAPAQPAARDCGRPSVIVMPFDNLSGEADVYFVDGVVEEVTSALSRVRDFFVIARQSAFTYKGRLVDVREVGHELGVSYVVEGTVRRGGDRLRISVQLVDAETRAQLWSERYEGSTTDVFAFQDQIAAQVAGAINPAVRRAEIETARRKPPESLQAYDLVMRAYPKIWGQTATENVEAIALLRKAIGVDPRYGRAHALLAWCHSQAVVYLWTTDPEADRGAARQAVEAATGLVDDDPTAMAAVGAALSQSLDDLARADAFIAAAIALDPNNAWAWARHGWLAVFRNEADAAIQRFERSLTLNPLDPLEFNLRGGIAVAHGLKAEYVGAARLMREMLATHPQATWGHRQLAYLAALAGDLATARAAIDALRRLVPGVSIRLMRQCHPVRNRPLIFDKMVEGWRLAGLPEE